MRLEISKRLDGIAVLLCHSGDAYLAEVVHCLHGSMKELQLAVSSAGTRVCIN